MALGVKGTIFTINNKHNSTAYSLPSLNINKYVTTLDSRQHFHSHCHENLGTHFPVILMAMKVTGKGF
jgi:hypothetical protein